MNKAILLIVPVLALSTTATIIHQQQAHANPYLTNFGDGYADGTQRYKHFIQADTMMQAVQYLCGTTYRIAQHITLATTHGPNFQHEMVDDEQSKSNSE